MHAAPRTVIGVPLYGDGRHLSEAIESLLAQPSERVAIVLVDDGLSYPAREMLLDLVAGDGRVTYERNVVRLGLLGNWRRVFARAGELYPRAEFFAWASDHDVWHPDWLNRLLAAHDSRRNAVLTYPRNWDIDDDGAVVRHPWAFDTSAAHGALERLLVTNSHMSAGNMVYGLFRREALQRAGVYRRLLLPDRMLMLELAVQGHLIQVPEILWYRRRLASGPRGRKAVLHRQRATLFMQDAPWHSHLPWWLTHAMRVSRLRAASPDRLTRSDAFIAARAVIEQGRRIDREKRLSARAKRRQQLYARVLPPPARIAIRFVIRRVRNRVIHDITMPLGAARRRAGVRSTSLGSEPMRALQKRIADRLRGTQPPPELPSPEPPAATDGTFLSRDRAGLEVMLEAVTQMLQTQRPIVENAALRMKRLEAMLVDARGAVVRDLGQLVRIENAEFLHAARQVTGDGRTLLTLPRLYTLWNAARNAPAEGCQFAEVGSYRGGSAAFLATALRAAGQNAELHVIDTFEGHPAHKVSEEEDPGHEAGRFGDALVDDVRAYLARFSEVAVHHGEFTAVTNELPSDAPYGLVHVDVDIYTSTLECLEYFAPRMARGACSSWTTTARPAALALSAQLTASSPTMKGSKPGQCRPSRSSW